MPAPIIAAGAVVSGLQLINGFQQADLIRMQSSISRQVADLNSRYAELDAFKAEQDGLTMSARYQSGVDAILADQKVAYAARNVDFSFGTARAVQDETKLNGFLNTIDIQTQAQEKALGLRREAREARLNSTLGSMGAEQAAASARSAGILQAAGTGLKISGY